MRIFFIVAVCLSALTSVSVNAQTPSPTTLSDITREHPEWFTEPDNNYKPCPRLCRFSRCDLPLSFSSTRS